MEARTRRIIGVGLQLAVAAWAQAQPPAAVGELASTRQEDQRRAEVRQAIESQYEQGPVRSIVERRLSVQERAELREQLRLSAQRREDPGRR